MENGEVVTEEPTPSVEDQMLASLDHEETGANEDSPTSVTSDDTVEDSGSDTEKVEAQDESEKVEEVKAAGDSIPKKAFTKRINGLQAAKRKAEAKTSELENRVEKYDLVFADMKERLDSAERRLSQYEEGDDRDVQLRQLKLRQSFDKLQQQQSTRQHAREIEAQKNEIVNQRAEEIVSTAEALSEKYNTFSKEELVIAFSKSENVSLSNLAKSIHQGRVKSYRKHIAKGQHVAPAPIRTQGAKTPTSGHSSDDMVQFLESISGEKR